MTYQAHLNRLLETLLSSYPLTMTAEQIISCLDLTLLDEQASLDSLSQLKKDAQYNQVAAVCVYPHHLPAFLQLKTVKLATVINFPQGQEESSHSLNAIEEAVSFGTTEIDYVFPYSLYSVGKKHEAFKKCQAIIECCQKKHLTLGSVDISHRQPQECASHSYHRHIIAL